MPLEDEKKMRERCEASRRAGRTVTGADESCSNILTLLDRLDEQRILLDETHKLQISEMEIVEKQLDKLREQHKRVLDACAAVDWDALRPSLISAHGQLSDGANMTSDEWDLLRDRHMAINNVRDIAQELRPESELRTNEANRG